MNDVKQWFETWFDSPYYHILYDHRDEIEAERFILNLAKRLHFKTDDRVLDLGCGAGRHAAFLAEHTREAIGIDLSEQSILSAMETYKGPNLEFYVHDMRLPFRINYFNYILNFFTSFGYFKSMQDNLRVLESARKGLRPGGTLMIDFMNAEKAVKNLVEREEIVKQGISFYIRREVFENRILKHIKFEADGTVYSFTESVQAFRQEQLLELASQAGFEAIDEFGDYDLSDFDVLTSPRYILVLKKNL